MNVRDTMSVRTGLFIGCALLLLFLAACTPPPNEEPAPPAGGSSFPMEVIDQANRTVSINQPPEKIVSLAPSNTEIIYALGLEDRLFGVTEYCDYPEAAKQKPQIGGFNTVDIERVVEIQPDLILASNIHRDEVVPQLERLGLTVVVLDPWTIDEVLESINLVGRITGKVDEASHLTADMERRIRTVTDKTAALTDSQRPKVLYIVWHDPLMTVSSETRIHELIVKAGGVNIASDLEGGYPTISLEAVIMANPDVIIAGSEHGSGEDVPMQFALTEPRLAEVAARKNGRVYEVDSDLTSRPGPRIADGLERMAELIHPELFQESR